MYVFIRENSREFSEADRVMGINNISAMFQNKMEKKGAVLRLIADSQRHSIRKNLADLSFSLFKGNYLIYS